MKQMLCAMACSLVIGTVSAQQKVTSILEILDVQSGNRTVVKEFPYLIEAPNWTVDGAWLIYNSGGKLYRLSPQNPGEPEVIPTGFATRCNNDHVLSADGKGIAISHGTREDGRSRIYTLPIEGGTPRLVTPILPYHIPTSQVGPSENKKAGNCRLFYDFSLLLMRSIMNKTIVFTLTHSLRI
jgi:Tol biopolymer transport system component